MELRFLHLCSLRSVKNAVEDMIKQIAPPENIEEAPNVSKEVEGDLKQLFSHPYFKDKTEITLSDILTISGYYDIILNIVKTSNNVKKDKNEAWKKLNEELEQYDKVKSKIPDEPSLEEAFLEKNKMENIERNGEEHPENSEFVKEKKGIKRRGRKSTCNNEQKEIRRKYYETKLKKLISVQECLNWHSCQLTAALVGTKSLQAYFDIQNIDSKNIVIPFHHQFLSLFDEDRFFNINSCISVDVENAQDSIKNITKFYTPTNIISSDETMIACHQRHSPHFIFIAGKPHPVGILFTSAADSNCVVIGFNIRNRTEEINVNLPEYNGTKREPFNRNQIDLAEPKSMKSLVEEVTTNAKENSTIITDRLYSDVNLVKSLFEKNQHGVMKCSNNRPPWIFSQLCHQILRGKSSLNIGDSVIGKGYININGKNKEFFLVL